LRCSTCEQLYCGEGDSCHAWCSEECANGRDCKCVACARVAARPAPQYERSSSGASPEQIAEARQRFEARKARPATCDGCADLALYVGAAQADIESLVAENTGLRDRIAALERDVRFLRTRVGGPAPDLATVTVSASDQAAALIASHRQA